MTCNTTYYTLTLERFFQIATEYPRLRRIYNDLYTTMLNKKDRDISLDYMLPQNIRINTGPGKELNLRDMQRCIQTQHRFKNAVMYFLHANRKEKKLPKLKDVLEKVVAK